MPPPTPPSETSQTKATAAAKDSGPSPKPVPATQDPNLPKEGGKKDANGPDDHPNTPYAYHEMSRQRSSRTPVAESFPEFCDTIAAQVKKFVEAGLSGPAASEAVLSALRMYNRD